MFRDAGMPPRLSSGGEGSTGIPEDGYIAYETGYMNDGPFHGELAPMQEAGIASKARRPAALSSSGGSRLASLSALRRRAAAVDASARTAAGLRVRGARKQQFVDGAGDEQVPAGAIDGSYFVGQKAQGPSIDAMSNLV